jgi:hypothetical protein
MTGLSRRQPFRVSLKADKKESEGGFVKYLLMGVAGIAFVTGCYSDDSDSPANAQRSKIEGTDRWPRRSNATCNNQVVSVPDAGSTLALLTLGLGGLAVFGRMRTKRFSFGRGIQASQSNL